MLETNSEKKTYLPVPGSSICTGVIISNAKKLYAIS